jgi:hypothetical protein
MRIIFIKIQLLRGQTTLKMTVTNKIMTLTQFSVLSTQQTHWLERGNPQDYPVQIIYNQKLSTAESVLIDVIVYLIPD